MPLLTKSKYVLGLECERCLWDAFNDKENVIPATVSQQHRMSEGLIVGQLAQQLFPEGILLPQDWKENIAQSKKYLKRRGILFEAGFLRGSCYARADILLPSSSNGAETWDIVEVKSSTSVKEEHVSDVAFQKYCYTGAGLNINKCYLIHINNEYVRQGAIDPYQLFSKVDITADVAEEEKKRDLPATVQRLLALIANKTPPIIKICEETKESQDCHWELPPGSVFDLYRGGKKSLALHERGVELIKDISSDEKLTDNQVVQREVALTGKPHVNKEEITTFLKQLTHPLSYLDFETFNNGIPPFDGTRPYQAIPFQYSLHIVDEEGTESRHVSYLYKGTSDPRKEFIEHLRNNLPTTGTIIVYNQSFEMGKLRDLALAYPEHAEWVADALKRIIDLLEPFKNFNYYNPAQQGSNSIKAVLPAMTGKGYEDLEIADGDTASIEYVRVTYGTVTDEERARVYTALEEYCGRDTMAMVEVVRELRKMVSTER